MAIENASVAVFILVRIVALDFHDFGDEAPAGAAFEMHDDVERIADVGLDGAVGEVHAALQYAARESREALPRRRGMYGRKTAGVSGVEKLQEIEGLGSSNFAELRGEYICSWCEMRDGYLSAVPHPKSKCEVRRFAYPREADIVGRVIGVTMRLVEGE
jgi:hypothetical protein